MAIPNSFLTSMLALKLAGVTQLKMMLLTSTHTTDIDTQEFIDDVSANEFSTSGTGYTGAINIANPAVAQDNTNDRATFDFDDVTFSGITGTSNPAYGVLYDDTGTPGTSEIWTIIALGDISPSSQDIVIQLNAVGLWTQTAA